MLDWNYGYGYPEKNNEVCCKNCSKHIKLDLPHQDFYCKAYNKIISRNHIDDKIECEEFKREENKCD